MEVIAYLHDDTNSLVQVLENCSESSTVAESERDECARRYAHARYHTHSLGMSQLIYCHSATPTYLPTSHTHLIA